MPGPGARSQVVILGAGRSVRGDLPSAMVEVDAHGRVMDWLLEAFEVLDGPDVFFVAGFKADEVAERYPGLRFVFNRSWSTTGPAHSLGLAPLDSRRTTYVSYADVVFRPDAVKAMDAVEAEAVVAVDSSWRHRYDGRVSRQLDHAEKVLVKGDRLSHIGVDVDTTSATGEFAGLMRLGPAALALVQQGMADGALGPRATVPDLVTHLLDAGVAVTAVDLDGQWAELDAKQDLARFVLGTKAESLQRLRNMNHGGVIGTIVAFTFEEWQHARRELVMQTLGSFTCDRLIVRSSALSEDGWTESGAGCHDTVPDVIPDEAALGAAVDDVFASYDSTDPRNQVLIQEMLTAVKVSGVVMTRAHGSGAPYYVINFDAASSRTDAVTAGRDVRTIYQHRDSPYRRDLPAGLSAVLETVTNVERLVGHDSLDIEFAVTDDDHVHILQVRPIVVVDAVRTVDDAVIAAALEAAEPAVAARLEPTLGVVGQTTRYSVMADWNPAEIVGTTPRRLALSLYRYLITDDIWAQQRAEYGYRDVRPCALLVDILGHPYVDVRATFNSFIPASLSSELAGRLCDHYLAVLAANPTLHDKVEFDILLTCVTADLGARTDRLRDAGFTVDDVAALRDALIALTLAGVDRVTHDLATLPTVSARIAEIERAGLAPLDRAYYLLDAARRPGTLVFAHLARGAFVATSLLRSLVATGAMTDAELDVFLGSVETVAGRFREDGGQVGRSELGWDVFINRYGHLRPGTYDITSPTYAADAEAYLRPVIDAATEESASTGSGSGWLPNPGLDERVEGALASVGLPLDAASFWSFAAAAIAGREEGKFVFTRALSGAIEAVAEFGATVGLSREELSHITIGDLLAARDVLLDGTGFLRDRAESGREGFDLARSVCLPAQIATAADLTCFEQEAAQPNYVTQHSIEAPIAVLDEEPDRDIAGRIVLIRNADPGFDFLFSRGIAGLVTMFGGANSHMAVRSAEMGLPAAIGVGELLYADLARATSIRLDCGSRNIAAIL